MLVPDGALPSETALDEGGSAFRFQSTSVSREREIDYETIARRLIDDGYRVIAVHTSLTQSGIVRRLDKDINDLAAFNNKGLMYNLSLEGSKFWKINKS